MSGLVLLIAGLVVGWLGLSSRLPGQSGNLYEDPQVRLTMEVGPGFEQVEADRPYAQFKLANPASNLYLLVLEAKPIQEELAQSLEIVGCDPGLQTRGDGVIGDWKYANYTDQDQMERLDLIQHTEEGGLIENLPNQNSLASRLIPDRQPVEPVGPAIRQMSFYSNLIDIWLFHRNSTGTASGAGCLPMCESRPNCGSHLL